jgi:O-methyltransferase involved in polyketide biosynthesis
MSWIFGLDPKEVEGWLNARGLRVVDRADAAEYRARFAAPAGRKVAIYAGEYMVLAEVVK